MRQIFSYDSGYLIFRTVSQLPAVLLSIHILFDLSSIIFKVIHRARPLRAAVATVGNFI